MKRSEFLKRLGFGAAAVVAAPPLSKGEERAEAYHKWSYKIDEPEVALDDSIDQDELVFWRNNDNNIVSSAFPTFLHSTGGVPLNTKINE